MATQTIQQQTTGAIPHKKSEGWQNVRDFFGPITEVLSMCFPSHVTISQLSSEYRANLSVEESTTMDARFMSLD